MLCVWEALSMAGSMDQAALDLFIAWAACEPSLVPTQRKANHKCLLKPYMLYVPFMLSTRAWWKDHHGYTFVDKPGQVGDFFSLFRDKLMLPGLRHARAKRLGVSVEDVEETRVQMKTASERRKKASDEGDGEIPVRAILGWEWRDPPRAVVSTITNFTMELDEALPIDDERCASFDMDETAVHPEYTDLITADTGTSDTKRAENAHEKKRPRGRAPNGMKWAAHGEWVPKRAKRPCATSKEAPAKRLRIM
jgi:hypothetical protein